DTSSSTTASSAPSSTAEGSTASSEASNASAAPSATTSANAQATNGEQSSIPSGARLIIYPVGVAIKNPTGSIVDSDTSTVRIVAIPDTTTTDYTKYIMKQVSTALPSTTASASTSASASAVPSSSMSFSPSPSAEPSRNEETSKTEEKKPLAFSKKMNLDQIAQGDFSSIQGAWQSGGRTLYVEGNKAEWNVGTRVYAELDGTKIYGVQSRSLRGTATARTEGGALYLTWPSGEVLSFYPAGVKIPYDNVTPVATDLSKDRIVSGKVSFMDDLDNSIMMRVTDTPAYSKINKNAGIPVDAADYASGSDAFAFQAQGINGSPTMCAIRADRVDCHSVSETQSDTRIIGAYKAVLAPYRPSAEGRPVSAYYSAMLGGVRSAPPAGGTAKTLEPGQKISANGFTCSVLDTATIQCFDESSLGFIVSPHGAVSLPVQNKLNYFNSEFVN
ncbi:MAG: DUF6287 domain-containing protein, partial [Rothia sp. (in: high G+C Gram-positive bacteria)]|uniref:DUF6287 domain-containing protein n=1 Tax=Rothia sp. (in: high G+C Gram-positive bacteria) TaxID=1885016 RepID=UPI0026E10746